MGKRILILSASVGAGHIRAAEALKEAFMELDPQGEVVALDFLRHFNWYFGRMVEEAYYAATRHVPRAYKFLYDLQEFPPAMRLKNLQGYLGVSRLVELFEELRPDAVVCTHFFPAGVVSQLMDAALGKTRLALRESVARVARGLVPLPRLRAVVLTDYVSHPFWLYSHIDLYFVAHEEMRQELIASGIPPESVYSTGIPIRRAFSALPDRAALRRAHLARPDWPLILVASGGHGIGPFSQIVAALNRTRGDFQVAIVTGKNPRLEARLRRLTQHSPVPMQVLGFVQNIHEWMAMADLLISKAGGLTVSEALAAKLPMIIVRPTPGQEVGNTAYLLEHGAACYLEELADLPQFLALLLRNPECLERMRAAAEKIARPQAARDVAALVLSRLS
ncbi:MAG: glycosyltransferase [Bacillota bacterium]|nr:glycosyltransferase [Bacillota bacterium]